MLERKLATTMTRLTLLLVAILLGVTVVQLVRKGRVTPEFESSHRVGIVDARRASSLLGVEALLPVSTRLSVELQKLAHELDLELITAEPLYVGSEAELVDVTDEVVERLRASDE